MKGVIAFLDILGYQSFLENNSATDSALKVLDMITTLPKNSHAELSKAWTEKKRDKAIVESLQHVIFSDTIVLLLPFTSDEADKICASVSYITLCAAYLTGKMFASGLPLRGAIHEGEFIVKDTCFAGGGIVEAYRLCNQLDFSGLVIGDTAFDRISAGYRSGGSVIRDDLSSALFVPILSPLKANKSGSSEERRLTHVNWTMFADDSLEAELKSDVIQCVMSRFWMHDKDCPSSVDGKIRNTCKMLRRLGIARPFKGRS